MKSTRLQKIPGGGKVMKKVLVVMVAVIGLALVTSGYAQMWDTAVTAQAIAKGKPFNVVGVVKSVDKDAQTAVVEVKGKTYTAMLGYAKYEGDYSGASDIKVGDKLRGKGMIVNGQNWVTKLSKAQ
jgi:hypothetical protein